MYADGGTHDGGKLPPENVIWMFLLKDSVNVSLLFSISFRCAIDSIVRDVVN